MGWTFYDAWTDLHGKVDRKYECDRLCTWDNEDTSGRVLKSTMRGSVYYGAYEWTNKKTNEVKNIGIVILTSSDKAHGFNFGYKDMTESMGPGYYDCPKSIIDLLSPTENEYAIEWRKKCIENAENKKKSWLKKVAIGEKIIFTRHDGKELVLVKHAPAYQFKTWFWYNPESGHYIKKNQVNETNSRLYA